MANSLTVDWSEVNNLSKNTLQNSTEFETARKNFQDIINTIPECWDGEDSKEFLENANSFLTSLQKDTLYFEALGKYFDHSSKTYNKVVDEAANKFEKVNQELMDQSGTFTLIPDGIVGETDGKY